MSPKKNLSSLVSLKMGGDLLKWFFIIFLTLILRRVNSVPSVCELSFTDRDKRINYSLAAPFAMFPHGVFSEDGAVASCWLCNIAGRGLGWFGTFITIILCLFGSYLLAGTVYRFFVLGVCGVNAIPNLDTWVS